MSEQATIDLSRFCRADTMYAQFARPFVRGGWQYATNGYIGVRVPAPGVPDTEHGMDISGAFATRPNVPPQPWPDTPCVRGMGDCRTCEGTGYPNRVTCSECDGDGEMRCPHCDQDMECRQCNGDGYKAKGRRCEECNGAGQIEQDLHQRVGEWHVRGDFVALIRALPNVQWAGNAEGAIHFLFDGGEGVVMRFIVRYDEWAQGKRESEIGPVEGAA